MSQFGGSAAAAGEAPISKAYSPAATDLFKRDPTNVTARNSKYETFTQSNISTEPLEIIVPRSEHWRDMKKIIIEYELDMTLADGTPLAAAHKVAPVNNMGHSAIKSLTLAINGNQVGISHNNYPIQAYFDRLLNYGDAEKDTWMSLEGWHTDEAGKFDVVDPIPTLKASSVANITTAGAGIGGAGVTSDKELKVTELAKWLGALLSKPQDHLKSNKGATARHKATCTGVKTKFIIEPVIDLFTTDHYLPPGCELKFRIYWSKPEFFFNAVQGGPEAAPKFKVVPYSTKIHMNQIELNSELHLQLEGAMMAKGAMALFPHFSTKIKSFTLVDHRREHTVHNVFQGTCPNYMIVGFQEGAAYLGNYTKSFTNFKDMHQTNVRVTRNGEEIPIQRLELAKDPDAAMGYNTLLRFSGNGIQSAPIGIDRASYKEGNYLLAYNFNPDGEQNFNYKYQRNVGNVNISADFTQDTANNTTLIVVGYFEEEGWLDGNKIFTLRYNH